MHAGRTRDPMVSSAARWATAIALAAAAGCTGSIAGDTAGPGAEDKGATTSAGPRGPGGPGPSGPTGPTVVAPPPAVPGAPAAPPLAGGQDLRTLAGNADDAGPLRLRGLTRAEYNNTIAALLGDSSAPALTWGTEVKGVSGFLEPRPISMKEVQEYMAAATAVAERAKASLVKLGGCDPATSSEETCAQTFVRTFGRRAFRRPVTAAEQTDYVALWTAARKTHGLPYVDAVALVIEAMLQSPSFMYHWQLGPEPARAERDGLVRLNAYEIAARLSYFLTQSPPDELLAAAADSGKILQSAELDAQAARLMATPKAKELMQDFVAQLLDVSEFGFSEEPLQKTYDLARRAFVDKVVFGGKATVDELLLNPEFHVNARLSSTYGLTDVKGETLVARALDPAKRFGVLTHPDFLSKTGRDNDSLPPRRGKEIWSNLLCGELPSDVPPLPPEIARDPKDTMREHFEKKVEPIPCAMACHGIVDNAGFAFESYGGAAWRDKDAATGKPINAAGALTLPFGGRLTYTGTRSFVEGLAASEEVKQCMVRQIFRLAVGRAETLGDVGSLKSVYAAFRAGGDDLKVLAASVVKAKAFSHRRLNPGEIAQ